MPKRLTTSATDAKIFGVCGGVAEYFNIDPILVRVIVVVATVMSGVMPGIITYIACALIMPRPGINRDSRVDNYQDKGNQN